MAAAVHHQAMAGVRGGIGDKPTLVKEVAAWCRLRRESGEPIRWLFDVERVRQKLGRSYPHPERAENRSSA